MRDPIENVTRLQKQLNNLQLENQVLKNILDKAGLSYQNELASIRKKDTKEDFDPEQGKRIVYPKEITDRMPKLFFSFFWGRTDVYAKRNVNKNGEAAYYPQCDNFWSDNCHRKLNTHIDCKDCKYCSYTRLDLSTILTHLRGNSYVAKDVIGVYPLFSDGTCRFLVFDFDNHEKNAEKRDFANTDDTWIEEVEAMRDICTLNGIEPLVERSRSGKGAHIWIFFDKPISAAVVRKFGLALLDKGAEQVNLKSFNYYDRMLPAQDSLENVAIGNLIALPLQGRALKDGNSAFVDGNWNAYPDQWNAYEIIHNNDIRDEQIVEDVKNCVSAGRTPVVLSRYKDHSEKLYERLKDYADHVFLMTGNNSKKEHKKILEQMHQVYKAESLILIATGSLVGEGFDFPRLDTLFMATPVSFRGVVEQYAGRLNRDYAGKENVIIYDYVDNHITMFNNMYMKRLKAYKQIGYEIAGGLHNDKQTANAIYDGDNYAENYHKDLLDANKNIIISSPAISGTKVYELINLLKEKQLSGVQITIVTWAPDSYGFGDASYWMQLHEEMRKAGFYIKTVEESCERFAVIDQEVVWYGNINLLAKDKVDDSIMRVLSKEIASELMEITFGDNG